MCAILILSHAEPRLPASYGLVERFRHQALVARVERGLQKSLGRDAVRRHELRHRELRRHELAQRVQSRVGRLVDDVRAIRVQAVEAKQRQRHFRSQVADQELAPEATHRVLKGARPARARERDDLAVEDEPARRQRCNRCFDLRQAVCDVSARARVDAHAGFALVDLHARTVELVFEDRRRKRSERACDVFGGAREHRAHGLVKLQPEALETGTAGT